MVTLIFFLAREGDGNTLKMVYPKISGLAAWGEN
jgi:hypothetical protein